LLSLRGLMRGRECHHGLVTRGLMRRRGSRAARTAAPIDRRRAVTSSRRSNLAPHRAASRRNTFVARARRGGSPNAACAPARRSSERLPDRAPDHEIGARIASLIASAWSTQSVPAGRRRQDRRPGSLDCAPTTAGWTTLGSEQTTMWGGEARRCRPGRSDRMSGCNCAHDIA
jgi:hypothetical protein